MRRGLVVVHLVREGGGLKDDARLPEDSYSTLFALRHNLFFPFFFPPSHVARNVWSSPSQRGEKKRKKKLPIGLINRMTRNSLMDMHHRRWASKKSIRGCNGIQFFYFKVLWGWDCFGIRIHISCRGFFLLLIFLYIERPSLLTFDGRYGAAGRILRNLSVKGGNVSFRRIHHRRLFPFFLSSSFCFFLMDSSSRDAFLFKVSFFFCCR